MGFPNCELNCDIYRTDSVRSFHHLGIHYQSHHHEVHLINWSVHSLHLKYITSVIACVKAEGMTPIMLAMSRSSWANENISVTLGFMSIFVARVCLHGGGPVNRDLQGVGGQGHLSGPHWEYLFNFHKLWLTEQILSVVFPSNNLMSGCGCAACRAWPSRWPGCRWAQCRTWWSYYPSWAWSQPLWRFRLSTINQWGKLYLVVIL